MLGYVVIAAVVVIALVALLLSRAGALFGRLFSPEHYRELVAWMPGAKAESAAKADEPPEAIKKGDPRVCLTAAGLLVFYTVRHDEGVYRHHISVSLPGRPTPHAVGRTFSVFVAERLGWDLARASFFFSQKSVFHAELEMSEAEHQAWVDRPISAELGADAHQRAFARKDSVSFSSVEVPVASAGG